MIPVGRGSRPVLCGTLPPQTVEAAYILAQEQLLEGLKLLKEECRLAARQQEVLIHSDMDQILEARRGLEEKVRGTVVVLRGGGGLRGWRLTSVLL